MKQVHRLAGHLHTATGMMAEGGNAIDVGIVCQSFFGEVVCDGMDHRGRAVHRGDDGNKVSGSDSSVVPQVSLKGCTFGWRQ